MEIKVIYPDDCTEWDATQYISGCFVKCQNDYQRLKEGYKYGTALEFGDKRTGYFYRSSKGWVLKLNKKEA